MNRRRSNYRLPPQLGSRILFVTAHPDDESYAFAGLCLANAKRGGLNTLICLTDGERGRSHLQRLMTESELRRRRIRELKKACRVLKISHVVRCRVPDGGIAKGEKEIFKQVYKQFRQKHPDTVVCFGPDGVTGHRDHIRSGRIAQRAARRLGLPTLRSCLPVSSRALLRRWMKERQESPNYREGIRFVQPKYRISFSRRMKQRALACHRSQMDGPQQYTGYAPFAVQALSQSEYYV